MKLDYKRTFLVGLAFLTISGFWVVYEAVIPLILRDSFGIGDTISGITKLADGLLWAVSLTAGMMVAIFLFAR